MRRPSQAAFYGLFEVGGRSPEDSTEESGITIPIQRAKNSPGAFMSLGMEGNGGRILCALCRGCSLKSVE